MPTFTEHVEATTNTVGDTEDTFVELTAAAGSGLRVKRVRISCATPAIDNRFSVRLVRKTVAGATGVAFTPVKRDPDMRASSAVCNVKNGVTAFTIGTLGDIVDEFSLNTRALFEWVPRGEEEVLKIAAGGIFGVLLKCNAASIIAKVDVEHED
jgi:hypothetical protein